MNELKTALEKPVLCDDDLISYQLYAIVAARDLGYSDDVIHDICRAKSDTQVSRILRDARLNGKYRT